MASRYIYTRWVENEELCLGKELKAYSIRELDIKEANLLQQWERKLEIKREREKIDGLKEEAEFLNDQAIEELDEYKNLLDQSIEKDDLFHWDLLKRIDSFPGFNFKKKPPVLEEPTHSIFIPKKRFLERFFKSLRIKREEAERQASIQLEQRRKKNAKKLIVKQTEYYSEKDAAYQNWKKRKEEFDEEKNSYNNHIENLKNKWAHGAISGVERHAAAVIEHSEFPDSFSKESEIQYNKESKTLVVSMFLPNSDDIPNICGYKYVVSTKSIKEIPMKKQEFNSFYDSVIKQAALKTLAELYRSDEPLNYDLIIINGWVRGVDKATGQPFTSCILSVQMSKEQYNEINFNYIDVDECIKGLKAVYAGSLSNLAPVKPILDISKNDSRFIESKVILDNMDQSENLATMPWEEFEHLVREVFSKYFSGADTEVKVTQSSRDGGVDAVAFDPDPIRGGKFIIQAKRYNKVVPVSAARDLYGTVINEGAVKGILVTTSYFGSDTREFIKDKPISLVDGNNLIYLLGQYGYDFKIQLQT
ncbi:MAG: restriction endonuclease [Massilioclostridium sp.]|nr:restriction endonuclease [Massilioclostridium sp.]